MQEKLISYETAKSAKEKGFNEECEYCYTKEGILIEPDVESTSIQYNSLLSKYNINYILYNGSTAPTQSLLQKWLRDVHKIVLYIIFDENTPDTYYRYHICSTNGFKRGNSKSIYTIYEEALEEGLIKALELI